MAGAPASQALATIWGGCQVTARDQARFFARIRALLPKVHREYALGLLRRIVSYERWGIPPGTPRGWTAYFKGGWFPDDDGWRVHQAALLRHGGRWGAAARPRPRRSGTRPAAP